MKLLVDENIPLVTALALRESGHDVLDIRGTTDEGMHDDPLWRKSQSEGRMLITTDKGFARHRDEPHHGPLIVRLRQPNRIRIHQRIMLAVSQTPAEEWPELMVVMRDTAQSIWRARQRE